MIDEWLVEYLSPWSDSEKVELAHTLISTVKSRCDKIIFSSSHIARFLDKTNAFRNQVKDPFYYPLTLHSLTLLLHDPQKAEQRFGSRPVDCQGIKADDYPVVESALAIASARKLRVTTDQPLGKAIAENCAKYGIECIDPRGYLDGASSAKNY